MLMPSFNVTVRLRSVSIGYENILDGGRRGTKNGGSSGGNRLAGQHCLNREHGCIQTGHFWGSGTGSRRDCGQGMVRVTAGIAAIHSGNVPFQGRNALHQTRDVTLLVRSVALPASNATFLVCHGTLQVSQGVKQVCARAKQV